MTHMPEECSKELRAQRKQVHTLVSTDPRPRIGTLVEIKRYASLQRLLRVTAQVLRAVRLFRCPRGGQRKYSDCTSPELLSKAEHQWIGESQRSLIQHGSFKDLKAQFKLYTDEKGLWRCGGRLANAEIPYLTKHPIMLSRDHPLTSLIVVMLMLV